MGNEILMKLVIQVKILLDPGCFLEHFVVLPWLGGPYFALYVSCARTKVIALAPEDF